MRTCIAAVLVIGASACNLPNPSPRLREEEEFPNSTSVEPTELEVTPVAPDETLAPAPEPGTVRIVQEPIRQVDGVSNGKVWLLELYQKTLADKEELTLRLADSERARAESQATQAALTAERDELALRAKDLDRRVRELEAQSLELARRLADSEIARLETQKSELERAAQNDRKERP